MGTTTWRLTHRPTGAKVPAHAYCDDTTPLNADALDVQHAGAFAVPSGAIVVRLANDSRRANRRLYSMGPTSVAGLGA